MDCGKAQRLVQDLVDGRLDGGVASELQRHMSECTDCRVAQQRAIRLQQLLSVKRYERPGQDYFDGFLGEFHRRLADTLTPQPTWWDRILETLHVQNVPTLRYGFAHAFGVILACGIIARALVSGDVSQEVTQSDVISFGAPHWQAATALPAPHSTPPRIAALLPSSSEIVSGAGGALILPVETTGESSSPRYVLDRISRVPSTYEVASIHF
jgi:hypothetical protein